MYRTYLTRVLHVLTTITTYGQKIVYFVHFIRVGLQKNYTMNRKCGATFEEILERKKKYMSVENTGGK